VVKGFAFSPVFLCVLYGQDWHIAAKTQVICAVWKYLFPVEWNICEQLVGFGFY